MKKSILYCLLAILCLFTNETSAIDTTALKIGERLPAFTLSNTYNYASKKISSNQFKGKYFILDFWATWCSNCIAEFPAADSFQQAFGDRLQLILVNDATTGDDAAEINQFINTRLKKALPKFSIPIVALADLKKRFPHKTIPRYVWLDPFLRVVAITQAADFNRTTIEDWLAGKPVKWKTNTPDLSYNIDDPLFFNNTLDGKMSGSVFAGEIKGIKERIWMQQEKKLATRITATNQPVFELVRWAWSLYLPANRLQVDSTLLQARYCYEIISPPIPKQELIEKMKADLRAHFNINVTRVKRQAEVWDLTVDTTTFPLHTVGGKRDDNLLAPIDKDKFLRNTSMKFLVGFLDRLAVIPVTDASGIIQPFDLEFSVAPSQTFDDFKKALEQKGFHFTRRVKEIEMVIVQSTQKSTAK